MTLRLHGFAASNYYNNVKLALIEKNLPFEEVLQWADGSDALQAGSPLGKIPYLETEAGFLSDSQVINEYLEEAYPESPLIPDDPFAAAKVRELVLVCNLYLEWEARRLYAWAFFGNPAVEAVNRQVSERLDLAVAALVRLTRLDPFATGSTFTLADCALVVHLPVVASAGKAALGRDVLAGTPLKDYLASIADRPSVQRVNADRKVNTVEMMARRASAS